MFEPPAPAALRMEMDAFSRQVDRAFASMPHEFQRDIRPLIDRMRQAFDDVLGRYPAALQSLDQQKIKAEQQIAKARRELHIAKETVDKARQTAAESEQASNTQIGAKSLDAASLSPVVAVPPTGPAPHAKATALRDELLARFTPAPGDASSINTLITEAWRDWDLSTWQPR